MFRIDITNSTGHAPKWGKYSVSNASATCKMLDVVEARESASQPSSMGPAL